MSQQCATFCNTKVSDIIKDDEYGNNFTVANAKTTIDDPDNGSWDFSNICQKELTKLVCSGCVKQKTVPVGSGNVPCNCGVDSGCAARCKTWVERASKISGLEM